MTDLSVIIVSYNVRDLLATCLLSLEKASEDLTVETWVVDNASDDDTVSLVRKRFPWVKVIANTENLGFAKANNLALKQASGRHLMLLNPDTILRTTSLSALVNFLDGHPEYGAVGPKLLNEDGTYQPTGKRSVPTPWSSFCKLSGLSATFPRSRFFNQYELGYLHEDRQHEIGALCGAAMMVRREAYEKAGGLDEQYFMYGEDIAWSDAIRRAGWKIGYLPDAPIMHLKGQSTKQDDASRDRHFFDAMKIFYRHRMRPGPFRTFMMDSGVELAKIASRLRRNRESWRAPLNDSGLLATWVWLLQPLLGSRDAKTGTLTANLPVVLLAMLGAYRDDKSQKKQRTPFHILTAAVFAFLLLAGYFFTRKKSRSRLFLILYTTFGWGLLNARHQVQKLMQLPQVSARSVIAGPDNLSRKWLRQHYPDGVPGDVWAWALWGNKDQQSGEDTLGLDVFARVEDLPELVKQKRVTQVLFSTGTASYEQILTFLELSPLPGIKVRIIDESSNWPAESDQH